MAQEVAIKRVQELIGDRLSLAQSVRDQHGHDEFHHHQASPDAVAFALSTEEVVAIVNICRETGTPLIPYGTGTSVEGHIQAIHGGISLDVSGMDRVLAVNPEDFDCTVQPGVRRKQLNEYIRDTGLFFPVDPGADASLGGMTATRASGTNAVRYGTMKDSVLSVQVVLPDGRVITTASRAKKSAAGLDLTRLFVGSEGILGVITEITLRLYGIPEAISAAVVSFPSVDEAVSSVVTAIQSGIPIARVELLDEVLMAAVNAYSGFDYPAEPTLFMEFNGTIKSVEEQIEMMQAIVAEHGGGDFNWASDEQERNRLWQARHDSAYAAKALREGCELWGTDVCVPLSRLTECMRQTRQDLESCSLPAPMLGHVGDGNFHLIFVLDMSNEAEIKEAEGYNERMIERALAMDGTCTGEHGIGLGKKDFLVDELGETVDVMRQLKLTLDPTNFMNPGKMLDIAPVRSVAAE
ncbi:MAG: FAD-linked oxidase C-terminal domain-containing protein [Alphaproteobacteria bacterium]|jgi:D-lactate dehydrogenase (cytochrome)|nr:FAD-linked oxidase C-terminal domain-containing protein [Alphaproteobacteria bacterium]MDP6563381.1 FAD-linked oxidase C-terminal domain-containing protein [Alphaproteobacteria bacterium]MDP6812137.1 FAD-linked oxidase C-terminal domain-containing protein [Alphaproteobacteria bacterium]